MASQSLTEKPQFTSHGFFTLGYVLEDGIYREKQVPYISERQRDILEARATHEAHLREMERTARLAEMESEIERARRLA